MLWTDKYSPKKISDIVGNGESLIELKEFILNYKTQKKNSIFVYGPTGSGKTCAVHSIANENNLEVLEINASDVRNKAGINEVIGGSIHQASLFSKGKIILIDEVDGLSGTKDRGGVKALCSLIGESPFPIVLTANDPWSSKLSPLRKKSKLVELEKLSYLEIFNSLNNICKLEKISVEDNVLKRVSILSGGDLRAAINDLQTVSSNKSEIVMEDLDILGDRQKEEEIVTALNLIFKGKQNSVFYALNQIDMNLDESLLWIEENLPQVYKGQDLSRAFSSLSTADLFRGRIRRQQHWRFLVYQNAFMTGGVSFAKFNKPESFFAYKRSSRILKLWIAKMKYGKRNAVAEKLADRGHTSKRRALQTLQYLKTALKNDDNLLNNLDIDRSEIEKIV